MSQSFTGGCQCGALRYRIDGEISYPHICHCRMCQKASGNYFLPLGAAERTEFHLTRGEPTWFQSSGVVRRGFCSRCGTQLFFDIPEIDNINIVLGSLDEPERVKPVAQCGTGSRLSFIYECESLPVETEEASADWLAKVALKTYQHPDHDTAEWPPKD